MLQVLVAKTTIAVRCCTIVALLATLGACVGSHTQQQEMAALCCGSGGDFCTSQEAAEPYFDSESGEVACPEGYSRSIDHFMDGSWEYTCVGKSTEIRCKN